MGKKSWSLGQKEIEMKTVRKIQLEQLIKIGKERKKYKYENRCEKRERERKKKRKRKNGEKGI